MGVFADAVSNVATEALFDRRGAAWRHGWDYTPWEALEAVEGWSNSNSRHQMSKPDHLSLIEDVSRGLKDLHTIIAHTAIAPMISDLLGCMSREDAAIDWNAMSSALPAAREALRNPAVAVAVWHRAHRNFALHPGHASSWNTLATLDGALRLGEYPTYTLHALGQALRDPLEGRPNGEIAERLAAGVSLLEAGPPHGTRIAWLMILDAECSPWVIPAGSVTFFDGGWFSSVYANDLESRSEIPPEVTRFRLDFDPARLRPRGRDDEQSFVLARVDLGHGPVAKAQSTAAALVSAVVSLSKLAEGSPHWRVADGCLLLVDGDITTWPSFFDSKSNKMPPSGRETWLDSLSRTAPHVERVLTTVGAAGWVLAETITRLVSGDDRGPAEQLTLAAECSERLLNDPTTQNDHWAAIISRHFGSLFAVIDYRRHLAHLTMSAYAQASRRGSLPEGHKEIVTWRGDTGVDVLAAGRRIDDVLSWAEVGTANWAVLQEEVRHLSNPPLLRKRLHRDVEDYRRLLFRARRVRNAAVHGGHVEQGGLTTAPGQMLRSTRQLAYEWFHAYAEGMQPGEHLARLRREFEARISELNTSPESVLGPLDG